MVLKDQSGFSRLGRRSSRVDVCCLLSQPAGQVVCRRAISVHPSVLLSTSIKYYSTARYGTLSYRSVKSYVPTDLSVPHSQE